MREIFKPLAVALIVVGGIVLIVMAVSWFSIDEIEPGRIKIGKFQ